MYNLPTGATQRPSKKYNGESHSHLKGTFLSVLAGVDTTFPKFIWDNILVQREITLNLLCQDTPNPSMSAWEYLNGAFDYTATPLVTIWCNIIIHTTSNKQKPRYQRGSEGFSIGPALYYYRCIQAINSKTKSLIITDTLEYFHAYITQPHVTT